MHDKYKKHRRSEHADTRVRLKIAVEAAKRLYAVLAPEEGSSGHLRELSEPEYYAAKRKAAAVLGRAVRPGDLPSDSEVREQVLHLVRTQGGKIAIEDEPQGELARMADHLDRFAIYKLRLDPMEKVALDPRRHPEGDALYHSLQVFERAREARPYDEEFLLAALLHDVGKAIEPREATRAALEALDGAVSERTAWLIGHHRDSRGYLDRTLNPKARRELQESDLLDDLLLLRELDEAGRIPGVPVGTVDEALNYLRGLEAEAYLDTGEGDEA